MHRYHIWCFAALLVCFGSSQGLCQQPGKSSQRWGILAVSTDARNLGELLTAELSTIDGIQLVEREEIDRVLGEMRLTASGAVAPKHAIQLGKLAKADALILLDDANATKQQFLRVRLIDTRTSIRLVDKVLAKTDFESDVATIRNSLASKANTLSVPARQLRYISVSNIVNGETGRLLEPFCKTLRQLVTSELHHRDRLVVVEREDLQRLTAEKELSGINLHIRAAASIFESSVRRSEDLSGYVVSCRLTRLGDSSVQRFDVPVASKDVLAVRQKVVDSIASQLDTGAVKRSRAPVSREQEAAEFDRRATQFAKAYRPETSTELREVAFALEPSPDRLRQLMLDYRSLVRDKLGRRRDTEALLAAFRHNQFRALNAKRYNIRMRSFDPSKPPQPKYMYGKPLVAKTPTDQKLLLKINSLRRQVFADELVHAADQPLRYLNLCLQAVDMEMMDARSEAEFWNRFVKHILRSAEAAKSAQIRGDPQDGFHRAIQTRIALAVGHVFESNSTLTWNDAQHDRFRSQLASLDPWVADATELLFATRAKGAPGQTAARKLLAKFSQLPTANCFGAFDKVFRKPALWRIPEIEAQKYGQDVIRRVDQQEDTSELLTHCHSASAFLRGMDREQKRQLATHGKALSRKYPRKLIPYPSSSLFHDLNMVFLGAGAPLHDRPRPPSLLTPSSSPNRFHFSDAPGPWQEYHARKIQLKLSGTEDRIARIHVDYRADAIEKGGRLVLIRRGRNAVRLERVGLDGGTPITLGPSVPGSSPKYRFFPIAIADDAIYVASNEPGFSRITNSDVQRFDESAGAATADVFALAWLDGKLYIAYRDALGSYDPKTNQFKLYAAATSAVANTPFDGHSFFIHEMIADPTQSCLWMRVQVNNEFRKMGLWKFTPAENSFQQHSKSLVVLMSRCNDGILLNRSVKPPIRLLNPTTSVFKVLPEFSHALTASSNLATPRRNLIRVGNHLIGDDGSLMTADGKTHRLPGRHAWSALQVVGDGFITHYDRAAKAIWYVEPKPK